MSDLIDREALLRQIDIDSEGEPGYYGDTWKFIDTIKNLPSVTDKNVGTKLGTNLASHGTDCISRQQAINLWDKYHYTIAVDAMRYDAELRQLPPIQPKRGRWIKLDMHRGMADHKCTACEQECYVPTCMGEPMYAFCPNCGAKMEVNHEID